MLKLTVDDLYLEITRRCNMHPPCQHCLRGKPESVNMNSHILDSLFSRLESIRTLTFTGGEPSMVPEIMLRVLHLAELHHVPVSQVYIVTNGRNITDKFLHAVTGWHKYTIKSSFMDIPEKIKPDMAAQILSMQEDNEDRTYGAWVALSIDKFHGDIAKKDFLALSTLPHLVADKCHSSDDNDEWIWKEGLAIHSPIGNDPRILFSWRYANDNRTPDLEQDGDAIWMESLYVGADGSLCQYCDYSYRSQKDHSIGTILSQNNTDEHWLDRLVAASEKEDEE